MSPDETSRRIKQHEVSRRHLLQLTGIGVGSLTMSTVGSSTARAADSCVNGPVERTYTPETVNLSKVATARRERDNAGTIDDPPPAERTNRRGDGDIERPPAAGAQHAPDSNGLLSVGTDYDGIRESLFADFGFGVQAAPPDTNIAAGRSKNVEVINKSLAIFNQRSGELELDVPLDNFFDPLITEDSFVNDFPFVFDPRVRYDQESDRFLVLAAFLHLPTPTGAYFLAASATSNPNGKWYLYRFRPAIDTPGFVDYPPLGVDRDAVYLTEFYVPFIRDPQFPADFDVSLEVLDKDALYAGNEVSINHFTGLLQANGAINLVAQPAFQPSSGGESGTYYLMASQIQNQLTGAGPDDTFSLWEVTNPLSNPTVSCSTVKVEPWTIPPFPEQPDTSVRIDPVGNRLMNLDYDDGSLWTAHTIRYNWSDGTDDDVAVIRWYEIDPDGPEVVQYGTFGEPGTSYYLPHIRSDGGRTLVGYNVSGPETYPSIKVAGRTTDTTTDEMDDTALIQQGESALVHPERFVNRDPVQWGDYMGVSVHPTSGEFWVAGEYSPDYDVPLDAEDPDLYQTRIAEVSFEGGKNEGSGTRS